MWKVVKLPDSVRCEMSVLLQTIFPISSAWKFLEKRMLSVTCDAPVATNLHSTVASQLLMRPASEGGCWPKLRRFWDRFGQDDTWRGQLRKAGMENRCRESRRRGCCPRGLTMACAFWGRTLWPRGPCPSPTTRTFSKGWANRDGKYFGIRDSTRKMSSPTVCGREIGVSASVDNRRLRSLYYIFV